MTECKQNVTGTGNKDPVNCKTTFIREAALTQREIWYKIISIKINIFFI